MAERPGHERVHPLYPNFVTRTEDLGLEDTGSQIPLDGLTDGAVLFENPNGAVDGGTGFMLGRIR